MELRVNEKIMPTICLNMIVKNESKIITRLFDSVLSIIDCYCICDTGSNDNTVEIIKAYFDEKLIPGKIIQEPFQNFAYNRTFALNSASGMSDFALLMDADMILKLTNFNKLMLLNGADVFHILQGNDNFSYNNARIVRNNGKTKYIGVTHEYLDTPNEFKACVFPKTMIFINDVGDGGCKTDKFIRDIRLLKEGIEKEPTNERYHFYLANTYYDLEYFEEAIKYYKKRIELGGWVQEVWHSHYKIGLCYKKLGKMSDALFAWMEGYDVLPDRLEGVYEMLTYYRTNSKYKLFKLLYDNIRQYLSPNINRDTCLFLQNDVYMYKIFQEYTIAAFYLGVKTINDEVISVLNNCTNERDINNLLSNLKFYNTTLKQTNVIKKMEDSITIKVNNDDIKFNSSSSCLIPYTSDKYSDAKYLMNVRYVNYTILPNGSYDFNGSNYIISQNKRVVLNNNFEVIDDFFYPLSFQDRRYIGIEDVRIFSTNNGDEPIFIGTGLHQNNQIGLVLGGSYNATGEELEYQEITQDFASTVCEKNWVFVEIENEVRIVYNWHPLTVCDVGSKINVLFKQEMPLIYKYVRGSSCGYKYNGSEIWFVGHIVSHENPRQYYHIISVFDAKMKLLRYSAPFKFEGEAIEFCLSILVQTNKVYINYSNWDRTTRIGVYDKEYIDSLIVYTGK